MNKEQRPFSALSPISAPATLGASVRARIASLQRRAYIARLSGLIAAAAVSATAFVVSCASVWNAISSSGFLQYIALAFSDGAALSYSKELGLSIIESLPVLGIAIALSAGLVSVGLVWSSLRLARYQYQ